MLKCVYIGDGVSKDNVGKQLMLPPLESDEDLTLPSKDQPHPIREWLISL